MYVSNVSSKYYRVRELFQCVEDAHHEVHSVVMNGDILEMWYFDMSKPPPTNEELLKLWVSDTEFPALAKLRKSIKNLTENLDVKVSLVFCYTKLLLRYILQCLPFYLDKTFIVIYGHLSTSILMIH